MIIYLEKSKLFTVHPAVRFALIYKCHQNVWKEVWRRHKQNQYDLDGLCGYLYYKTDVKLDKDLMRRWMWRQEIYDRAHAVSKLGVRVVQSEFFAEYEEDVIDELTRSMRFREAVNSRSIV